VRERAYARAIVSAHARVNGERSFTGGDTPTGYMGHHGGAMDVPCPPVA
jgi:hypothetical protein